MSERRRLVVIGGGMAGLATVESAFAHRPPEQWDVTILCAEAQPPYNRVLLSQVVAGEATEQQLELKAAHWFEQHGVRLALCTKATEIDSQARVVTTDDGERIPYDALVVATGSTAAVPPIPGRERRGVHVFRTLADAREILESARPGRSATVIGGGLLGLEAARGLVARGMRVTVVHLVDRLMETQLDGSAARLLDRQMRTLGIETLLARQTTEIVGNGRVEGVRFASGEEIESELVVISTGIRPNVELARTAGLELERAILVDDELRTSAPGVWAVGECAEHRGTVYGIWAPLLEQARVAGASIAGQPAGFHGAVSATTLKVMGADLFVAGSHSARDDDEDELVAMDSRTGLYRKLVVRDGVLTGAILLGDVAMSARLSELVRRGDPVPEELLDTGPAMAEPELPSGEDVVCACNGVTAATIDVISRDRGLQRVSEVSDATRAGTGCGGCRPVVKAMLERIESERNEELRDLRLARR